MTDTKGEAGDHRPPVERAADRFTNSPNPATDPSAASDILSQLQGIRAQLDTLIEQHQRAPAPAGRAAQSFDPAARGMTTIATQTPTPAGRDCAERRERAGTVQLSRDAVAIWVVGYVVLILGLFGIMGMAIVLP